MQDFEKIIHDFNNITGEDVFYLSREDAGAWLVPSGGDNQFNGADTRVFSLFYRSKSKAEAVMKTNSIKTAIDGVDASQKEQTQAIRISQNWDYLSKDAEGYFVFVAQLVAYL